MKYGWSVFLAWSDKQTAVDVMSMPTAGQIVNTLVSGNPYKCEDVERRTLQPILTEFRTFLPDSKWALKHFARFVCNPFCIPLWPYVFRACEHLNSVFACRTLLTVGQVHCVVIFVLFPYDWVLVVIVTKAESALEFGGTSCSLGGSKKNMK